MPLSSGTLVDAYLTHLTVERRLAVNSVESYARDLTLLATFAAGRGAGVEALARPDLESLVRDLMSEGRSPRSVARAVACFRGLLPVSGHRWPHRGESRR
jgi:integrase/recombinase XerD